MLNRRDHDELRAAVQEYAAAHRQMGEASTGRGNLDQLTQLAIQLAVLDHAMRQLLGRLTDWGSEVEP